MVSSLVFCLFAGLVSGFGLFGGLLGGLFVGLLKGLLGDLEDQSFAPQEIHHLSWVHWVKNWKKNLVSGLVFGLFIGLFIGLFRGLFIGLSVGLFMDATVTENFLTFRNPYSRFRAEMKWEITQGIVIIWPLFGIVMLIKSSLFGIYWGWAIGLMGIIQTALFKHICLLLCFRIEGTLPLRVDKFLKEMVDIQLLEPDGGRWRFRHELLHDYFCEKEEIRA